MLRLRISAVVCAIALLFGLLGWAVWRPADQAMAATNGTVNFQARLQTAAGNLVPDGFYNVEFKLYNTVSSAGSSQGSCAGDSNCLWVETRTGGNQVRVVNGYLTVNLGSVNVFGGINWDQELWLTMNVGGTGSPSWDGEMTPRLKLTAVPYAFRAGQLALQTGANTSTLGWAAQNAPNSILLPDEGGTICLQTSSNCGFVQGTPANFIQNQNAGAQPTSNFWISGTGRADAAFHAPLFDTATATALNVGTANASSITIGNTNTTNTIQSGTGGTTVRSMSNSTTALSVQNASSTSLFRVSTDTNPGTYVRGTGTDGEGGRLYFGDATATWDLYIGDSGSGSSRFMEIAANGFNFHTQEGIFQTTGYNGTTTWKILTATGNNEYFSFQGSDAWDILTIDAPTKAVHLGGGWGSGASGTLVFNASDSDDAITLQAASTFDTYTLTLPTALGSTGDCLKQQNGSGQLTFTSCGAESGALQGAYNASVGGNTPEIILDATRGALDIQDRSASNGGTIGGNLLTVRGTAADDSTPGNPYFSVNSAGRVGIGTDTQERYLDLVVDDSTVDTPPFRILQQGGGDSSMEFATSNYSFFTGVDASKSGAFVINSSTTASNSSPVTPTHEQTSSSGNSGEDGGAGLISRSFFSSVSAGSLIVAAVTWQNTGSITCSDTLGSTYTTATTVLDGGNGQSFAVCYAIAESSGSNQVTATFTAGSSEWRAMSISEYEGISATDALDVFASQQGSGTTPASGSAATTEDGELIYGAVMDTFGNNWGGSQIAPGSGFTEQTENTGMAIQHMVQSAAGSTEADWTFSNGSDWIAIMVAFKAAMSSGPINNTFDSAIFELAQEGALTLQNYEDSAAALRVLSSSGSAILSVDTANGQTLLGEANVLDGLLVLQNASNSNAVTLRSGTTGASYTLTLPTGLGSSGDCLVDTDGSGVLGFANCDNGAAFIQGGNDFDGTAVLGTTDSDNLVFLTNNSTVLTLSGINGAATFQNSADSASALRVSNFAGNSVLTVDTESGHVLLGAPGTLSGRLVLGGSSGGTTTLQADNSGADHFVTLPNASGTVCLTSGNCSGVGGNGDILQGGNSFDNPVILGNNLNHNLELETNNVTRVTVDTSGNVGIGAASSGHRISVSSSISGSLTEAVNDDFDPSIDGAEWSSINNGSASTVCGAAGSVSGNALRFTGDGARSAATIDMDTSYGGTISFYLYTSNQGGTCEATENNEDVVLEYSNNNGSSWTPINTYDEANYHTITQVNVPIPGGAQTSSTRFRWRQAAHSGASFDNWTLDNIVVSVVPPSAPAVIYGYNNSSDTVDLIRLASNVGGSAALKFRVNANGDVFADGTFYGVGGVTTGSADLAEVYRNNDNAQPGDVVVFTDSRTVEKASEAYQTGLAGVVSTQPGFTLNVNENGVPVALSGRVPVKVSVANGVIQKGDYLTSGPDGKAQKATAAGPTIGTALEDAAEDGTIEVFVHLGYYDPVDDALFNTNVLLTLQSSDVTVGNLNVSGEIITDTLRVSGNAYIGGELEVGVAKVTSTLTVGGRIISKGKAVTSQALPALGYSEQELSAVPDPPVVADGTDTAGTITFTTGSNPANGELLRIAFSAPYEASPRIVLEPSNAEGAQLQTYITKTNDGFTVNVIGPPEAGKTYSFDYVIIGSETVSSGQ